jgi:hypothetical protein
MKHLFNEDFLKRIGILGLSKIRHGITVCSVLQDFIRDLVRDGFKTVEIVTIINFVLYENDIDFKLKYHHVYYFIKHNKIEIKNNFNKK